MALPAAMAFLIAVRARLRDEEVGVDLPAVVGERLVEVRRVVLDAVLRGELGELRLGAADEDRLDLHAGHAVGEEHAALLADREDRAHEVLPVAHAAGDAVHDDADGRLAPAGWSAGWSALPRCVLFEPGAGGDGSPRRCGKAFTRV